MGTSPLTVSQRKGGPCRIIISHRARHSAKTILLEWDRIGSSTHHNSFSSTTCTEIPTKNFHSFLQLSSSRFIDCELVGRPPRDPFDLLLSYGRVVNTQYQ